MATIPEAFREIGKLSAAYRAETEDPIDQFERETREGPGAFYDALSRLIEQN